MDFVFRLKGDRAVVVIQGDRVRSDLHGNRKTYRVYAGDAVVAEFEAEEVVGWWQMEVAS